MKVKQRPDDFRVEEFPSVEPGAKGAFACYRLEKRGWTTPDAVAAICDRWHVNKQRVSFAGLKDRHAHTIQYLTIHNGPERKLSQGDLELNYVGRLPMAYVSEQIRANRFTITLRDLSADRLDRALAVLPELGTVGVPNYFDDQRFGGVNESGRFVAKEMVLGNFEEALRLSLTEPYEHDRAAAKQEKEILTRHWGDWPTCRTKLRRGHVQSLVNDLLHSSGDFRAVCARLNPDLQGLHLAAWQSHIWNGVLSRLLSERIPKEQLQPLRLKTGEVVVPRAIPEDFRATWETLEIPLPSARLKFDPDAPWASALQQALAAEGIALENMKLPGLRKPFFSKGNRSARIAVDRLTWQSGEDELNSGRQKLTLEFELGRGSYATMVIKRITA